MKTIAIVAGCALLWPNAAHSLDSADAVMLSDVAEYPQRSAPAVAISLNQPTIKSQLSATVVAIPVHVGDQVARGDTLVMLDCTDYEIDMRVATARLDAAKARMELAQSQRNRSQRLLEQKLTSRDDFDARQSSFSALSAEFKLQQANKQRAITDAERCQIKAPFNGVVTGRLAAVGQLATMGSELITLIDSENIELSVQVSADDADIMANSSSFTFLNGNDYSVTLRQLSKAINPATRNREARFLFTGQRPLPGSAGKLQWSDSRPYIPARYIVTRAGQIGVNILEDGKAQFIPLPEASPGRSQPTRLPLETLLLPRGFDNKAQPS